VSTAGSSFLTFGQGPPLSKPVDGSNPALLADQLWYIGRDKNQYSIRSVSSGEALIGNGTVSFVPAQQITCCWQLIPVGAQYAILSVNAQGTRHVVGTDKQGGASAILRLLSVDDLRGPRRASLDYLWDFTREGETHVVSFMDMVLIARSRYIHSGRGSTELVLCSRRG
jgi:hypothetical protein